MRNKCAYFLLALLFSLSLAGAETGNQILSQVDDLLVGDNAPRDVEAVMTMTIVSANGREKQRQIKVWTKNIPGQEDWRVMKFMSPPDVENIGFLVLDEDQMYLYLPEFRRIRRIASHNQKENFMGSDFTYEDMGTSGFSTDYSAELSEENTGVWVLELTRKPESSKPYAKLKMWVSKESGIPVRTEMYDDSGEWVKEAEQEAQKIGDYWVPTKITMTDKKNNSYTALEMSDITIDQDLGDDIFTQRFLQRRLR